MNLSALLGFPGPDGLKTVLLSFLQRIEFPITDWESGGVVRTFVELESAVVSDLLDAISVQVAGGYLDSSEDDWLTDLAFGWYAVDRVPAKVAQQTVTLACAATHGPYTLDAVPNFVPPIGPLLYPAIFIATDGARYTAGSTGVVPSGGTLTINVVAETPGIARGLVRAVAVSVPGVSVAGASIAVQGRDEEKDASLAKRCDAKWPDLGVDPEAEDRVSKWVKAASTEITRTKIDLGVDPGGVFVTVAGTGGAVLGGAVTAAQTYVDARAAITDYITVQNASNLVVTAGGTVTVPATLAAQIKASADAAWITYLSVAKIGAAVYLSELIQAVMDAGAIDFAGATLNLVAGNLGLSSNQVPTADPAGLYGPDPAHSLRWIEV